MDPTLSVAPRTAGRATAVAGASFTACNRTFKQGFAATPDGGDPGLAGDQPYRRLADGHGL